MILILMKELRIITIVTVSEYMWKSDETIIHIY